MQYQHHGAEVAVEGAPLHELRFAWGAFQAYANMRECAGNVIFVLKILTAAMTVPPPTASQKKANSRVAARSTPDEKPFCDP